MMTGSRTKYTGITYPKILANKLAQKLWKWFMCKDGKHLFDEVLSYWGEPSDPQHYLYCDACGLDVHISSITSESDMTTGE